MNRSVFLRKVILRGLALFILANLVYAAVPNGLGRITLYNVIFPGRERFPYGENPAESYNLSLFDLDAMFSSHRIANEQYPMDEYRVVLIGDSALWGWLLHPEETLAGQLNALDSTICNDRRVQVYNLGYPTISLTKDLLILEQAMDYHPDLVIWLFTLEAFPADKQFTPPLVANNVDRVESLFTRYHLPFDTNNDIFVRSNAWNRTIIGQRRMLSDLFHLQLYGIMWSATGIDQIYPDDYQPTQTDFEADLSFHNMQPTNLDVSTVGFPILEAGVRVAGDTPIVLVNEPILSSSGLNSDIRYNYYYPRWAFDQYRDLLAGKAVEAGWNYLDLWDLVPREDFTNTPFHLTSLGESLLAAQIEDVIKVHSCP